MLMVLAVVVVTCVVKMAFMVMIVICVGMVAFVLRSALPWWCSCDRDLMRGDVCVCVFWVGVMKEPWSGGW